MKVGDKITFSFASGEKQGVVEKIFSKKVYVRVDFPRHPHKLIVRKLSDLESSASATKKKKKEKEAKKGKEVKKEKVTAKKEKEK